jgi:AcrR family transcriptional regulator
MLTRDEVIATALVLLDEQGAAAFSMRVLADRLGTYPNTVYWHAGNRDRVLALAVERALMEIVLPEPDTLDWRSWLIEVAREYRRVLHAHPSCAPLTASQLLVSPPALELVEQVLARLRTAGFGGALLTHAYNTFVGSVVGWVAVELAEPPSGAEGWQAQFEASLEAVDPAAHPTLAGNAAHLRDAAIALRWHSGRERPLDESFEVALRVWVAGLAALQPRRASPRA